MNLGEMNRTFRRYVGRMLPKPLKKALKRRLEAAASARFHGTPRASFRYATFGATGELRISDIRLLLPEPFAKRAGRWLANHPEDILELEAFAKLARQANGLMLDVGAHVGAFAVLFCKLCDHNAIAVEPVPQFQQTIPHTGELNHIRADRIGVNGSALGNRIEVINMHLEGVTGFAQVQKYESSSARSDATIAVPTSTVDAIRSSIETKIGVLKIDVEGFEGEVLEGARETIARDRPIILLEIHHEYLAERSVDLGNVLNRIGEQKYSLMRLNGRAIKPATVVRTTLSRTHLLMIPVEQLRSYQTLLAR